MPNVPQQRQRRGGKLLGELAKFGTIGMINVAVGYLVFNVLVLTVLPNGQLEANVIAWVVAATGSFAMHRHWTYRDRPRAAIRRAFSLFLALNLAGLLLELGVLALWKYGFGFTSLLALNFAKALGGGLGTLFRFWAYRSFVFAKGVSTDPETSLDEAPARS